MTNLIVLGLLALAVYSSFILFKELADVSQWVIQSKRSKTIKAWHMRHKLAGMTQGGLALAWLIWFKFDASLSIHLLAAVTMLVVFLYFSGYINPALMMRARQKDGLFLNTEQASQHYQDDESVIVYEVNGEARAHSDKQLLRPHVAGNGITGGKEVVMTYCGLTNLGMAVVPEIDGKPIKLRPMTQLENNLVMVDDHSDQPIQQLWARKESDVEEGKSAEMQQVATFRMPFAKFREFYPEGKVYINDYMEPGFRNIFWDNPIKYSYDRAMELIFAKAIEFQKRLEKPVFPTIKHYDSRLKNKELVWAFNIGDDYVAYTQDFVKAQGGTINTEVGGRAISLHFDQEAQSLGAYYRKEQLGEITCFDGTTESGAKLERVETLKAGIFWVVWANFFPNTALNRIS